jgi:hypothetical protein
MERKGDLLNQFAIISDLVEKVNMEFENSTMVFELNDNEFNKTYQYISGKQNKKSKPSSSFTVKMGNVDIIFNKSNDEKVQSV